MDTDPIKRRDSPSSFIYAPRSSVNAMNEDAETRHGLYGTSTPSGNHPAQVIPTGAEQGNLSNHGYHSAPLMGQANSNFTLFHNGGIGFSGCFDLPEPGSAVPGHMDEDCIYLSSGYSDRSKGFGYSPVPMSTDSVSETVYPSSDSNTEVGSRPSVVSGTSAASSQYVSTIRQVHKICLEASRAYLGERLVNSRLRDSNAFHSLCEQHEGSEDDDEHPSCSAPSRNQHRWSPYSRDHQHGGRRKADGPSHHHRRTGSTAAVPTDSLLANISMVCSGLWSQSQRDRLHVPNTERVAVENMTHLLEWAETIVLGDAEVGADSRLREREAENEQLDVNRVLTAGKNLCAWLGDFDGRREIDVLALGPDQGH